jgi:2'-5' RNA ligase
VEVADPSGGLGALQAAVVAGLGEAIGFRAERRRFLAHVTVGRVRTRPADVELPALGGPSFALAAVTLMRSRLGGGRPARYEALERVAL